MVPRGWPANPLVLDTSTDKPKSIIVTSNYSPFLLTKILALFPLNNLYLVSDHNE